MDSDKRKLSYILRSQLEKQYFSKLPYHQQKVFRQISACGTEINGVKEYKCEKKGCRKTLTKFGSCKTTGCPSCNNLKREKWYLKRINEIIPNTSYYSLSLKVPNKLSFLIYNNQEFTLDLILKSSEYALKNICNPSKQKELYGFFQVLHTSRKNLMLDYHTHMFMPCGYLKDGVWYERDQFNFDDLAWEFSNAFIKGLERLYKAGLLFLDSSYSHCIDYDSFSKYLRSFDLKEWKSFYRIAIDEDAIKHDLEYLSHSIFSLPTGDEHIIDYDIEKDFVIISCRDSKNRGKRIHIKLSVEEFVKRLARHIFPKGFKRIRYYGHLSNGVRKDKLTMIYEQLGFKYDRERNNEIEKMSAEEFCDLKGWKKTSCPDCGGELVEIRGCDSQNRAPPSCGNCES